MSTTINPTFAAIVASVGGFDVNLVTPEKSFIEDLDFDSLSIVEISSQVEDELSVSVPEDKLFELKTVGDFNEYLTTLL
jgi:acyl carrier protein